MLPWRPALTHHGLYALQIGLGLLFQVLFARMFGATSASDAYFAGHVVLAFLGTLPLFFTEMFMQHYHEIKARGGTGAPELFQSVSAISVGLGAVLSLFSMVLVPGIASLVFSGFEAGTRSHFLSFAPLLLVSLVLNPLVMLNNAVLNAEMRFALPWLTAVLAPAANLVALLVFRDRHGLMPLALAPSAAAVAAYGLQRWYMARHLAFSGPMRWRGADLAALLRSSAAMRTGHLLYSLKDPIVASFLSHLPAGTMSLYFYAQRLMVLMHGLASAPVLQVFMARVSGQVAHGRLGAVAREIRSTTLTLTLVFVSIAVPVVVLLPWALEFLFGPRLSGAQLSVVYWLFIALLPCYLIQVIEAPVAGAVISMRRSRMVISANLVFLTSLGTILAIGSGAGLGVFATPLALGLAQFGNLVLYLFFLKRVSVALRRP